MRKLSLIFLAWMHVTKCAWIHDTVTKMNPYFFYVSSCHELPIVIFEKIQLVDQKFIFVEKNLVKTWQVSSNVFRHRKIWCFFLPSLSHIYIYITIGWSFTASDQKETNPTPLFKMITEIRQINFQFDHNSNLKL